MHGINVCKLSFKKRFGVMNQWSNYFINSPTNSSSGKILIADVYHTEQTDKVKRILMRKDRLNQCTTWMYNSSLTIRCCF